MRILTALAVAAVAIGASAASAPSTVLIWASAPSSSDMAAAWPATASYGLSEGYATLQCRVITGGRLAGCDTLSDLPQGQGFARAAKGLIGRFQLKVDNRTFKAYQDHYVVVPFHFVDPGQARGKVRWVGNPRWISMPDPDRIQGAFPKAAADAGVTRGVGVIDCAVAADGHLVDCKVSREDPKGVGFGDAAMLVAPIMQMNPWTDDGRPVDGARVKLPVQFGLAAANP